MMMVQQKTKRETLRRGGIGYTVTMATKNPSPSPINAPQPSFTVRSSQVPTPADTVTMVTRRMQRNTKELQMVRR